MYTSSNFVKVGLLALGLGLAFSVFAETASDSSDSPSIMCPGLEITLDLQRSSLGHTDFNTDAETGYQVSALQRYLLQFKSDPAFGLTTIPDRSFVVGTYGLLTRKAVLALQAQFGIPQTGVVDSETRAKIKEGCVLDAPIAKVACPSPAITSDLEAIKSRNQTTGGQVSALQAFLYQYKTLLPNWPQSSRGSSVTGYFGSITRNSVRRFQSQFNVVDVSSAEYGKVGAMTREEITAQCDPTLPPPDASVTPRDPYTSTGPVTDLTKPTQYGPGCTGNGTPIPPGFCSIQSYFEYLDAGGIQLQGFPKQQPGQSLYQAFGQCGDGRARARTFNVPEIARATDIPAAENYGHYGKGALENGGYAPVSDTVMQCLRNAPVGPEFPAHQLNPAGKTMPSPVCGSVDGYTIRGTPIPPGFYNLAYYNQYLKAGNTPLKGFPSYNGSVPEEATASGARTIQSVYGSFGDGRDRATIFNLSGPIKLSWSNKCWGHYGTGAQGTTPPSNQYGMASASGGAGTGGTGGTGTGGTGTGGTGGTGGATYPRCTASGTPTAPGFCSNAAYEAYLRAGGPALRGFPNLADINSGGSITSKYGTCTDGRDRTTTFDIPESQVPPRPRPPAEDFGNYGSGKKGGSGYAPASDTVMQCLRNAPVGPEFPAHQLNPAGKTTPAPVCGGVEGYTIRGTPIPPGFYNLAYYQRYLNLGNPTLLGFPTYSGSVPGESASTVSTIRGVYGGFNDGRSRATVFPSNITPILPPLAQCNDWGHYGGGGVTQPTPAPTYQCVDGTDNDGDGLIDLSDPGCTNETDNDETNPVAVPIDPGGGSQGTNYEVRGGYRVRDSGECTAPNPLLVGNRCECQQGFEAKIFGKPRGASGKPGTSYIPIVDPGTGLIIPVPNPFGNGTGDIGSPGQVYMCVRQSSNLEAYQGGYMTRPSDITPTQPNALLGINKCTIDLVDDTVAKVLGPEGSDNTLHVCRKPNVSYTGSSRSSYGGMFHKRISGSCTQANILTGDCSCPAQYSPLPIANISGTGESPGALWLCMRSDTVDSLINPTVTPTPAAFSWSIQGLVYDKTNRTKGVASSITPSGRSAINLTAANPIFHIDGLQSDRNSSIDVRISNYSGYGSPEYNICNNAVSGCHDSKPWISGTTARVTMPPGGGYADLWWRLVPVQTSATPTTVPTPVLQFAKQNASGGCCGLWTNSAINYKVGDKIYERVSNATPNTIIYFRWTSGRANNTPFGPTGITNASGQPYKTGADGTAIVGPLPLASGIPSDWAGITNSANTVIINGKSSNTVYYSVTAPTTLNDSGASGSGKAQALANALMSVEKMLQDLQIYLASRGQ